MDLTDKIEKLKKEKNAVILAHNYQIPEVQDIADITGDSLGLSIEASKTNADIIVFCGVYFMAETAKILSPQKTVLIPDKNAGCPMADMITAEELQDLKKEHPKAKVLCYVNTSAEVKAECDICCTSANAMKVVENAFKKNEEVIFAPDKNLAQYVASQLNRDFIYWPGYCATHDRILPEHIEKKKKEHPEAEVIVHPECSPEVIALADKALSTGQMQTHVKQSDKKSYIIGTELGLVYRLEKDNPDKEFIHITNKAICPNMKKITLEKVLHSLEEMKDEVTLSQKIIQKAKNSIERMVEYV